MIEHTITPDMLPGILAEIAAITTSDVAIALARAYGGRRLYIPEQVPERHSLINLVGRPAALVIASSLGGERHDIPAARTILRWADAHRLRAAGNTHAEISAKLNITQAHVSKLLAGAPRGSLPAAGRDREIRRAQRSTDARQMNLFERID